MEAIGNVALIIGTLIVVALAYGVGRDYLNPDRTPPQEGNQPEVNKYERPAEER